MENRILIAGFGGQGVLSTGELLANAAMLEDRHVSWMPAYGPEMRGGAASCGVVIADEDIASPVVSQPTVLLAMSGPALARFEPAVEPGGLVVVNASLIPEGRGRDDTRVVRVPANDLAEKLGKVQVAGNLLLGVLIGLTGMVSLDAVLAAMEKVFYKQKKIVPVNRAAIEQGFHLGLAGGA